MFEKLEETFGVVPAAIDVIDDNESQLAVVEMDGGESEEVKQAKADKALVRETYINMLSQTGNALEVLTQIARGTEHPRAFDTMANLIKTITETAGKLDELADKVLGSKAPKAKGDAPADIPSSTVNNNLFVGSSEDLMAMIRGSSTKEIK